MTDRFDSRRQTVVTLTTYWSCILLGLAIPGLSTVAVDMLKHGQSLGQALHQWHIHLFAPGFNLFLVALLNALPFVLFAVFVLFHLGLADRRSPGWLRRLSGVVLATLVAIGLSLWTHVMTLWHPDAQGALAYFMLPMLLLLVIPACYVLGWAGCFAWQQLRSADSLAQ